jgi:hypothetical protein
MEAVKRNANSKEIVAITVQENAHIDQLLLPAHGSSALYCMAVYIFPDNDDHMIC